MELDPHLGLGHDILTSCKTLSLAILFQIGLSQSSAINSNLLQVKWGRFGKEKTACHSFPHDFHPLCTCMIGLHFIIKD